MLIRPSPAFAAGRGAAMSTQDQGHPASATDDQSVVDVVPTDPGTTTTAAQPAPTTQQGPAMPASAQSTQTTF